MKRRDFAYELPEQLIASEPLKNRTNSRLMVIDPAGPITHQSVSDLPSMIREGDVVVVNNTRVFPARLFGAKVSGGRIEVMIERLLSDHAIRAFVKASKAPKEGTILLMDGGFELIVKGRYADLFVLESDPAICILDMAEAHGHTPLPPYIQREDLAQDRERYQTVFAKNVGAVAAPTAGLHLDESLISSIRRRGALWCEITLHIGAGTFNPVRVDELNEHQMHSEWYNIPDDVRDTIVLAKEEGRRIIAIGTTTMRCLEGSAAANGGQIRAGSSETEIFITPGYKFNVVDVVLTNFHLPESTLLMLVAAFGGFERVLAAYHEAVREHYRFFSYGDACLITRDTGAIRAS
ncbi:MAG: tRNA preQ1(34) S-adenosylmethionine ribosyltransferase-isomerase QueA [Gammaproteobacteria bacterium]|nr:tRNA preQ1(34) S-adenosylmethionine ribosyltransferase-isomerase QueA [Gammaproteobacteria bacterium]HAN80794.1 tRNA preQ1(34) S-adenosylmethionine ribosyltransferase-isomerase QueA [Gammaproteobacteria bacterium]